MVVLTGGDYAERVYCRIAVPDPIWRRSPRPSLEGRTGECERRGVTPVKAKGQLSLFKVPKAIERRIGRLISRTR